jgi:subtilisin family serine protease
LYENAGIGDDIWLRVIGPNNTYDSVPLYCASNIASLDAWIADTINTDGAIRVCHQYFNSDYLPDPIDWGHNLDNLIIIDIQDDSLYGHWCPVSAGTWQIEMGGTGLGRWDAWIYDRAPEVGQGARKVFTGNHVNREHTITVPGYANEIITVGSVNSSRLSWKDPYLNIRTIIQEFGNYPADSISPFSSMGPSRDGRNKPDLYAPGAFIMSSRSQNVTDTGSWAHNTYWKYHDKNDHHYITSGTSLAAPHVAGLAALMLDKNPNAFYPDILSCMRSTSSNGYDGIINVYDAVVCLNPPPCQGECGDANEDGSVNVSDAIWMINYVFIGGAPPQPVLACGDANDDAASNVSDAVWIINYVFIGGAPPGDCSPGSWEYQGGDCCQFVPPKSGI